MTEPAEESFLSHLVELRDRLIRALVAVGLVFVCLMPWAADIYDLLAYPMIRTLPQGATMIATGVITPFFIPVKVTILMAFLVALPYVLYQVWAFVAPGLYAHEKRFGLPLVVASTLLFVLGMAFCYFFVFRTVFSFIASFAPKSITPAPDIEQYLNFVLTLFLAFGLAFEVPIVVIVLVRFGIVGLEKIRVARPYVIVGAFVVGAIFTPPDVVSQILLAVPLWLLYELGMVLARFVGRPAEGRIGVPEKGGEKTD
ncbi:MAG TPA: twin-arginine translocase subunit TatC [Rhodocyclaceae bacterium]|nr:MAG: twin arginine-targeting protein translocase TatC [Betaproteobacteria bacterium CG2_30_68_42]PIV72175.1 MAG: twin-arginine translocase subunit TatC [Rhodocyclales bacterium CG17_big_fil_post_rev_8_21_14_2_50_68_7]PIX74496.1 MAG: twin-arginine translocase subunit TatC [Rhodocyclales bacterium CG_4_10_14_3_um_filter_68_10]PJA57732.1 MAG: twin-arginine translocase subunit TatC [Rhodocyclales bacterium CG_4_9_14_3_um_filter_68_10]HCX32865.1 twin-arginine translocase subunit TatC [Rhodocyclac